MDPEEERGLLWGLGVAGALGVGYLIYRWGYNGESTTSRSPTTWYKSLHRAAIRAATAAAPGRSRERTR